MSVQKRIKAEFHLDTCTDEGDDSKLLTQTKLMKNDVSFHSYQNFEPELCDRFYCISVLIKFISVVFELVINVLRPNITSCTFKKDDTNFPPMLSAANF